MSIAPPADAHGGRINAYAAGAGTTSGFGEVVSFETKLSFREFLRCLLKLGEEKYAGEKVNRGCLECLKCLESDGAVRVYCLTSGPDPLQEAGTGLAECLLRLLETMDMSEQALICNRTGLLDGPLQEFEYDPNVCYE